jgi:hypothetical protein
MTPTGRHNCAVSAPNSEREGRPLDANRNPGSALCEGDYLRLLKEIAALRFLPNLATLDVSRATMLGSRCTRRVARFELPNDRN